MIVRITDEKGQSKQAEFTDATLVQLIAVLVDTRGLMRTKIPEAAPKHLRMVRNPRWELRLHKDEKLAQLNYRHPTFGWQAVGLSSNKARKLGEAFINLSLLTNE